MSNLSMRFTISPTDSLSRAWKAVMANLGIMAGFTILFYIAEAMLGMIPIIGGLAKLFDFIFTVSLFSAFNTIDRTGKAEFGDLFSWTPQFGRLFGAYLVVVLMALVLLAPALIFTFVAVGAEFLSSITRWHFASLGGISAGMLIGVFLLVFIGLILLAIFTFAFMFIMQFRDLPLAESLKMSIRIGGDNIGKIVVFAFLSLGVAILGLLALFIGLLVAIPLIVGTQYYLLRSIFPIDETGKWDFIATEPHDM